MTQRHSEALQRALFESLDEAVCLLERLPLRPDGLRDYRYVAMNPAMRTMFGIPDLRGGSMRDHFPDEVENWYDDCDRVLQSGEPIRLVRESVLQGKVLESFVARVEDVTGPLLLVVIRDVTERKRNDERQAFLLELGDALRPLVEPSEMTATATRLLGERLEASRAYYVEWPPGKDSGEVARDYAAPGLPSLEGRYPIDVFRSAHSRLALGETWVVEDATAASELDAWEREYYLGIGVTAWVDVPLVKEGQLQAALCIVQTQVRRWTTAEITLAEETAERCWAAIERGRAEAALRESEERLQAMIGIEGVGVLTFREDGTLIGANDAFLRMHGYSRGDVESGRLTWRDLTPEPYVDESERQMERLVQTGRIGPYETEYLRKDGSRSWLLFAGAALGDGTFVEYCIDISDRKSAEAALRESEERLRLAKDAAELGIHDFDPVSGEIRWDERVRALWGLGPEEPVDFEVFMAGIHPDDRARTQAAVDRAIDPAGTGDYDVEYRVTCRADGQMRWLAVTGQTTFEDGRAVRLVGTVQDITERKRVESELREALTARDQFLGFISHELRTPMTVILGTSRLLARKLVAGAARDMASDIATSAEELNDLIDSLLLLARVEGASASGSGSPSHLGRIIERVLERQRARDPDREYEYRAEASGPVVDGEEAWLERVLVNLVTNAAKYSPPGRPVTIVLGDGEGEVRVRVLDEGDGLDEEEVERLFEPFYRGASHDGQVPGAGLGLTVCKRIVESMGGRMWAGSRVSGGAEFGFAIATLSEEASSEA